MYSGSWQTLTNSRSKNHELESKEKISKYTEKQVERKTIKSSIKVCSARRMKLHSRHSHRYSHARQGSSKHSTQRQISPRSRKLFSFACAADRPSGHWKRSRRRIVTLATARAKSAEDSRSRIGFIGCMLRRLRRLYPPTMTPCARRMLTRRLKVNEQSIKQNCDQSWQWSQSGNRNFSAKFPFRYRWKQIVAIRQHSTSSSPRFKPDIITDSEFAG